MSRATINCPICEKSMRRDKLFRHCKSAHAELMARRMIGDDVEFARTHKHTVLKCKSLRVPISVCAVCGKGATTIGGMNDVQSATQFYTEHTECRKDWNTVSWLWGVGKKPKAKPRGRTSKTAEESKTVEESKTAETPTSVPVPSPVANTELRETIAGAFPIVFDKWDYSTDDDEDDEEIEENRNSRTEQHAMDTETMITHAGTVIQTVIEKQRKVIASKRACAMCPSKEKEIDELEQRVYMLRQRNDEMADNNKQDIKRIAQLQQHLSAAHNKIALWRSIAMKHGLDLEDMAE
jgi:hypothetical protein